MSDNNVESSMNTTGDHSYSCTVCGSPLYITDHGNHELTFHCSSGDARFWDYDRGTWDQTKSKEHWDKSRKEIFHNLEEGIKSVLRSESPFSENNTSAG